MSNDHLPAEKLLKQAKWLLDRCLCPNHASSAAGCAWCKRHNEWQIKYAGAVKTK